MPICLLGAVALSAALVCPPPGGATTGCAADAMLVFDGSASMAELGFDIQDTTRIVDARQAVRRAMPQITPYRRVGLIAYGPGPLDACSNINLRFPPAPDAADRIISAIDGMQPSGLTPLTNAVRQAAGVLSQRGIVVLVTDGNETCGGTPCALGAEFAATAPGLTVHVIGFKVVADFFSWDSPEAKTYSEGKTVAKCLADRTGGMFISTETVDELTAALTQTLGCALIGRAQASPSAQGA